MANKPYHHPDLKRTLVRTARRLVERQGPDGITVTAVAKQCGVSVAAPYRHFEDKKALLAAVAQKGFIELVDEMTQAAASEGSSRERIISGGVAYVRFAMANPNLFRLMFTVELRDPDAVGGPEIWDGVAALIDGSDLKVPVDVALRTAWGLAHGLASLRVGGMRVFQGGDFEEKLREELNVGLQGVTD